MGLRITDWAKTIDGIEVIEQQIPFCIGGQLWQGWGGTSAIRADESQMTDDEIRNVMDIDGSKQQIWEARRNRLNGRLSRKMKEYDERRHELRKQRTEIITAMEQHQKMGLKPSPDDVYQVERIDERMARLRDISKESEAAVASLEAGQDEVIHDEHPHHTDEPTANVRARCDICKAVQPASSTTSAARWISSHKTGAHLELYKQQKALERSRAKTEAPQA